MRAISQLSTIVQPYREQRLAQEAEEESRKSARDRLDAQMSYFDAVDPENMGFEEARAEIEKRLKQMDIAGYLREGAEEMGRAEIQEIANVTKRQQIIEAMTQEVNRMASKAEQFRMLLDEDKMFMQMFSKEQRHAMSDYSKQFAAAQKLLEAQELTTLFGIDAIADLTTRMPQAAEYGVSIERFADSIGMLESFGENFANLGATATGQVGSLFGMGMDLGEIVSTLLGDVPTGFDSSAISSARSLLAIQPTTRDDYYADIFANPLDYWTPPQQSPQPYVDPYGNIYPGGRESASYTLNVYSNADPEPVIQDFQTMHVLAAL